MYSPSASLRRQTNQGYFLVDDVQFEGAAGVAINVLDGTPSTQLLVRGCKFVGCDQARAPAARPCLGPVP